MPNARETGEIAKKLKNQIATDLNDAGSYTSTNPYLRWMSMDAPAGPGSLRMAAHFHFDKADRIRQIAQRLQSKDLKRYKKIELEMNNFLRPWATGENGASRDRDARDPDDAESLLICMGLDLLETSPDTASAFTFGDLRTIMMELDNAITMAYRWPLSLCKR